MSLQQCQERLHARLGEICARYEAPAASSSTGDRDEEDEDLWFVASDDNREEPRHANAEDEDEDENEDEADERSLKEELRALIHDHCSETATMLTAAVQRLLSARAHPHPRRRLPVRSSGDIRAGPARRRPTPARPRMYNWRAAEDRPLQALVRRGRVSLDDADLTTLERLIQHRTRDNILRRFAKLRDGHRVRRGVGSPLARKSQRGD